MLSAKTVGELEVFIRDLPAAHERRAAPAWTPAPNRPTDAIPHDPDDNVVAVLSAAVRKGRWRAGRRIHAYAIFGSVEIDLSEAIFEYRQVVIKAFSLCGSVEVRVPENISLRGTKSVSSATSRWTRSTRPSRTRPWSTSTAGPSSAVSTRSRSGASSSRTSSTGFSARSIARSTGVCANTWIVDGCESGRTRSGRIRPRRAPGSARDRPRSSGSGLSA